MVFIASCVKGTAGRRAIAPVLMLMRLGITSAWMLPSMLLPGQRFPSQASSARLAVPRGGATRMDGTSQASSAQAQETDLAQGALEHRPVSLVNKIPFKTLIKDNKVIFPSESCVVRILCMDPRTIFELQEQLDCDT
jgi:hypothetical protein